MYYLFVTADVHVCACTHIALRLLSILKTILLLDSGLLFKQLAKFVYQFSGNISIKIDPCLLINCHIVA